MPRPITRVDTTGPATAGFIGPGHSAVEVVTPTELAFSDPFVLLMDDRLVLKKRRQIGAPHPHAGLETVTLVLDGVLHDRDEGDLHAGDALWMSAGSGVIHNEAVEAEGYSRILQLWIGLPARARTLPPGFELIRGDAAPTLRTPGVVARLYSGRSGELVSPTRNRVATTLVDVTVTEAAFTQDLPPGDNGFVYVLDGALDVSGTPLVAGQVGWIGPGADRDLVIRGTGRLVLYAGEPHGEPLIQHGPFVAGSRAEIGELHRRYQLGGFPGMSQLAQARRPAP